MMRRAGGEWGGGGGGGEESFSSFVQVGAETPQIFERRSGTRIEEKLIDLCSAKILLCQKTSFIVA